MADPGYHLIHLAKPATGHLFWSRFTNKLAGAVQFSSAWHTNGAVAASKDGAWATAPKYGMLGSYIYFP